jgi:ubiquinone/menaquinone biosynthesis C-methylase UbiE
MHRMALRDLTALRPDRLPFAPFTRCDEAELMDLPDQDEVELAENLRDIRRVNRLLGGTAIILRHLPCLIASIPPTQAISVLDLATGSGDIPLAISRWAKRHGTAMTIVASDLSEPILREARKQLANHPKITLARYDARAVPLPDKSVDIALCSLSLHHFRPDDAVHVLREMDRIARHGFILNDLRRGRIGYAAAWLAAHITTRNRLTRNDAPLSIRRAYTPDELADLLQRAGVAGARISTHLWFRMAAVKTTPNAHA